MRSSRSSGSGSGSSTPRADLEAGACSTGLHLRSRPSCTDLTSWTAAAGNDARPLLCTRARSAAALAGRGGGLPGGSPRAAVRAHWRRSVSAVLSLALVLVLLARHRQLYRHGQDAVAKVYYGLDPNLLGRSEARYPAPHCCRDEACSTHVGLTGGQRRVAVVTYLRDDAYLPLLQQLDCTLRRSNPHLELGLMHVPGELADASLAAARALNITLLPVPPLEFPNTYEARYGRNWLKVRALGLAQYDSILLVDSDVAVVSGGLDAIFGLPVEFAAVWDQSKWLNRWRTVVDHINGGVFLLRPCAAVEAHMVGLLEAHPKLRFVHGTAEQEFFGWYYRYTGATLPLQWNCQAEQCLEKGVSVGGAAPKIVHFTDGKPFQGPQPGVPGHEFLCSAAELQERLETGLQSAAGSPGTAQHAAGAGPVPQEQQQQQAEAAAEERQPAEAAAAGGGAVLAETQQQQAQRPKQRLLPGA